MKCADCQFWQIARDDDGQDTSYGLCHRMPPIVLIEGRFDGHARWPSTDAVDWCGEFKFKHIEAPR